MTIVSFLRRAVVVVCVAAVALMAIAFALAPAPASARTAAQTPARGEANGTAAKLELGATVLAGGSVALLVFGTIGIATAGERRQTTTAR